MLVVDAARLYILRLVWQWTGLTGAGNRLIAALDSGDETLRTLAGMFLVRTGRRSRVLVENALIQGQNPLMLIPILGDIGDARSLDTLEPFTNNKDPVVARAASDAIELLLLAAENNP